MKKIAIFFIGLLALWIAGTADIASTTFLATPVSCGTSAAVVNGTGFTSKVAHVSSLMNAQPVGIITVTFTRTTGTASEVDFEFQASSDEGTTWTTPYFVKVSIATNETAVSDIVVAKRLIYLYGITSLRLYRINNNDGSTALTLCNATFTVRS